MNDRYNILLVEDNFDHAELIKRSFDEQNFHNKIFHVGDGEQALNYLKRAGIFSDPDISPKPHIIILDLRIPKIEGIELLKIIKNENSLKKIPVIILTSSNSKKDKAQAYDNYANSYLVKPLDYNEFIKMINGFGLYWLGLNQNPFNNYEN